jgi:hypothetical protein
MLEGFISSEPALWLTNKPSDEVLSKVGNLNPFFTLKFEFSFYNRPKDVLIVIPIERWVTTEQNVKNATC